MKISIFNKWAISGGAARAAYRLYKSLRATTNHKVDYYVKDIKLDDKNIHYLQFKNTNNNMKLEGLIQRNYIDKNRTDISNTYFSFSYNGAEIEDIKALSNCDIINLHWVDKFLADGGTLRYLVSLGKPMVWTLHDMKPFTGGCHYNAGCREFENSCLGCKQLRYDPHNLAHKVLEEKMEILKDADLTIVSPSSWLAEEAKESALFRDKRIEVIPNAIETDIYCPINKNIAKEKLKISSDKVVLQFGAHNAKELRKGFAYLIEAINLALKDPIFKQLCDDKKVLILCMGESSDEIRNLAVDSLELGYISDDDTISLVYNATDLFILPTLEDNLPNTMLEAYACATPIVAFDTGGVTDIVKHRQNGIVVPKYDSKSLAEGIIELVGDKQLRENFGKNARKLIEKNYTLQNQAARYLELFNELKQKHQTINSANTNNHKIIYDDVIGYSFQQELQSRPDILGTGQLNYKYHELITHLNKVCQYPLLKRPRAKLKAYKNLLKKYHTIK